MLLRHLGSGRCRPLRPLRTVAAAAAPRGFGSIAAAPQRSLSQQATRAVDDADTAELWETVRLSAEKELRSSRYAKHLSNLLETRVLKYDTFGEAIAGNLAVKLNSPSTGVDFDDVFSDVLGANQQIVDAATCDLRRYVDIDPAAENHLTVFLSFKGFHAVQCARVANSLWEVPSSEGRMLARVLQCRMSHAFGVDIHPGAKLGYGLTLDHATGIVVGETAVIGNNVGFMHDVTLGSTGTSADHDRHPKVRDGVFLAAKCTVLGNVQVGTDSIIAANAVVTRDVPANHTAMGIPAKFVPNKRSEPTLGSALAEAHLRGTSTSSGKLIANR